MKDTHINYNELLEVMPNFTLEYRNDKDLDLKIWNNKSYITMTCEDDEFKNMQHIKSYFRYIIEGLEQSEYPFSFRFNRNE